MCMFLICGKWLEDVRACTGRTSKLHPERPGANLQPSHQEATTLTIVYYVSLRNFFCVFLNFLLFIFDKNKKKFRKRQQGDNNMSFLGGMFFCGPACQCVVDVQLMITLWEFNSNVSTFQWNVLLRENQPYTNVHTDLKPITWLAAERRAVIWSQAVKWVCCSNTL